MASMTTELFLSKYSRDSSSVFADELIEAVRRANTAAPKTENQRFFPFLEDE